MSIEKSNKTLDEKEHKGEKGFSSALLLNVSPLENSFRELSDGIENVRLNTSASAKQGESTQMISNLLTQDLLEGIDYTSPYHKNPQGKDNKEKVYDAFILEHCNGGVDDNDSAYHSSEKDYRNEEEIVRSNHSNIQHSADDDDGEIDVNHLFQMKEGKLKNNGQGKVNCNGIGVGLIGKQKYQTKPKDKSYINMYNDMANKYFPKEMLNGQNNNTNYRGSSNSNNDVKHTKEISELNDVYSNYMNNMMYQQQCSNYSFGLFNANVTMNMNRHPQLYYNYPNMHNNNNMLNYYPYSSRPEAQDFFPQQHYPISSNNNQNGVEQKHQIEITNIPQRQLEQQGSINSMNSIKKKIKRKDKRSKKDNEYLIEMFGRIGWICDQCNNFNYETRNKCNRCGVIKSPKKVSKLKKKQEANKKNQEYQQQPIQMQHHHPKVIDNSTIINQKKPNDKNSTENKGGWQCLQCKNVNFSFRQVCNRCQLPKEDNDTLSNSNTNLSSQYINHIQKSNNSNSNTNNPLFECEGNYHSNYNTMDQILNNHCTKFNYKTTNNLGCNKENYYR